LKEHYDLIEDHAWITDNIREIPELKIGALKAKDHALIGHNYVYLYGVAPSLHSASHRQVEDIRFQNMSTGLSLSEQLYTARGS